MYEGNQVTRQTLLQGGTLVPVDPDQPPQVVGDVLIRDSKIAGIGPDLPVDDPNVEIIDVRGHIVTPGFVDTHRHIWQSPLRFAGADWTIPQYGPAMFGRYGPRFAARDMYTAVRAGLAEALDAGITQIFDWNHNLNSAAHVEESIRAHRDSGMRVVLGYGEPAEAWRGTYDGGEGGGLNAYLRGVRRVSNEHYGGDHLRSLAMAVRGPEKSAIDEVAAQWKVARELGVRLSVHVGNGPNGRKRSVDKLRAAGLLGDDVTYIHCNTLADDEIRMVADSGGSVSVAPVVESNMGHGPSAIPRLLAAGVRPSLSVDTCTNAAGDLFTVMRGAAMLARTQEHERYLADGEWAPQAAPDCYSVLAMATIDGARANGKAETTGSLTVGKQADIVVIDATRPNLFPVTDAAAAVVMGANPGNVATVLVAGRVVKSHGSLLNLDIDELRAEMDELSARLHS